MASGGCVCWDPPPQALSTNIPQTENASSVAFFILPPLNTAFNAANGCL
jgi:hypothetical protein